MSLLVTNFNILNYSFKLIFSILKWLLYFFCFSILFIVLYKVFTSTSWLYAYEYFHVYFLIPLMWYYAPLLIIFIHLIKYKYLKKSNLRFMIFFLFYKNKFIKDINSMILFITFIGSLGQIFGGCLWQLPLILSNEPGFFWLRFGHHLFSDFILIIFYGLASVLLLYTLFIYYNYDFRDVY